MKSLRVISRTCSLIDNPKLDIQEPIIYIQEAILHIQEPIFELLISQIKSEFYETNIGFSFKRTKRSTWAGRSDDPPSSVLVIHYVV